MRLSSLSKLAVLAFSVGMGLSSHAFADGITATATFTDTPNASLAGVTDYSVTLNNIGTTTIAHSGSAGFQALVSSRLHRPTSVRLPGGPK